MLTSLPQWLLPLRAWQNRALATWLETQPADASWDVVPGAGKTLSGARLVHGLLRAGRVQLAIAVVPRLHLKRQTARTYARAGMRMEYKWDGGKIPRDTQGIAVTYQQLMADPDAIARHAKNAIVVLDELHHASEENAWGEATFAAASPARHRLALSGTLDLRTDRKRVPFVRYDEQGHPVTDISYSYYEAVADGVCRPVAFAYSDGEAEWRDAGGTKRRGTVEQAEAILGGAGVGEWWRTQQELGMGSVISEAHERLLQLRRTVDPTAAGLITARDQEHAKKLAGMVYAITGDQPALVVSDAEDSDKRLEAFAGGRGTWIVAVHMVSEGIDIPRLRVGIYASSVMTRLYIEQWKGRFVRAGEDRVRGGAAHLFVPAHPQMLEHVQAIEDEVRVGLHLRGQRRSRTLLHPPGTGTSKYVPISAELTSYDGRLIGAAPAPTSEAEATIWLDNKDDLRQEINGMVNRLARNSGQSQAAIHGRLNGRFSDKLREASEWTLHARVSTLKTMLAAYGETH